MTELADTAQLAHKEVRAIDIYIQLVKSTGVYSIAVIAEKCASLLLLPVYTHYLSTADYGTLELLNLASTFVGMILGIRLGQGLFVFYFAERSQQSRNEYISTALIGALLISGLLACIALPIAPIASRTVFRTPAYSFQFTLLLLTVAASVPVEVALSYIRVAGRPTVYVTTLLARLLAGATLNVVFLATMHLGVLAILWASLIVAAGSVLALTVYCCRDVGVVFSARKLWQLVRYSLPLGVSGVAMFVIHFCDRFFLQRTVSLAEIGLYALAYQLGWVVAVVQLPFVNYWNAQAARILQSASGPQVYARTCTYMFLALSATAVSVSALTRPLLHVMTAAGFWECAKYVPILAAGYVLRAIGDFVRYILVLEKRNGWDAAITAMGAATALTGYIVLIPRFRLWGAVQATVAAFAVMVVVGFWKAQRTRAFQYEYGRLFQIGVCATVCVVAVNVWEPSAVSAAAAFGVLIILLFPVLLWLCRFTTNDENERLSIAVVTVRKRLLFT